MTRSASSDPDRHAPAIRTPDDAAYAEAARLLRAGRLVAFPTETVYGLGADATSDRAVAGIFEAKGRPRFNPLIVHVANADAAAVHGRFDDRARALTARFWPGPLTLVLPRTADCRVSLLCSAGLATLAVRAPRHPVAQRLLAEAACPLAAPSANRSGAVSPTTAAHVAASLGARVPLILDGGPCRIGLESTVLDLSEPAPRLLRPGAVVRPDLEAVIGPIAEVTSATPADAPRSPGLLQSHYAPSRPLRLGVERVRPDEGLLAFGPNPLPGAARTINLSVAGNLVEAAANLFAALHALDWPELSAIAVMSIPETGLGVAINDRLRRAAAPRGAAAARD
jgi:L-threonylcarbamoyladenylate synthase